MLKSKPWTPKERAHRAGTIAWLAVLASFLFLVSILFFVQSDFLDFIILGSIASAVMAVLFGIRGLFFAPSPRIPKGK